MSKEKAIISFLVVLTTLVFIWGMALIKYPPQSVLAYRNDLDRVNDFYYLEGQISRYFQHYKILPEALTKLDVEPQYKRDPKNEVNYDYKIRSKASYELCTTFETDTRIEERNVENMQPYDFGTNVNYHPAGYHCVQIEVSRQ